MSNYTLSDYEAAKKSLSSTLRKIEKAQITLTKERVKALNISLDLIEKEIISLTKI